MSTTLTEPTAQDEAPLRALLAEWETSLRAKDVDRLLSHYTPDSVTFDVKPPYQLQGEAAQRGMWQTCLPYFPEVLRIEKRDERYYVGGDVAVAHYLFRFVCQDANHPATQTWFRATIAFQRHEGRWLIVHDHVSNPFDPHTGQVAFTLTP